MASKAVGFCGVTRRGFLLGTGVGLAAAAPLGWLALHHLPPEMHQAALRVLNQKQGTPAKLATYGMPGRFPGRVVEVHSPTSVSDDNEIRRKPVKKMMDRGLCELTGADHPEPAWKSLFTRGEIVGIKVNPVGRKPLAGEGWRVPNAVGSISSPEVLLETVAGLKSAGIRPQDIIVFERYADEFRQAGYEKVLRERGMEDVRWMASSAGYSDTQVDIEGHDNRKERDPNVVGYDPDVFVHMGFCAPQHDKKDDRRFRSHLSAIVTRKVDKFITIPVLKDHRSAGVTLSLKNLSHGLNNNVARSHISGVKHGDTDAGPNQCNTFIPTAVAQAPTREKATLHILDGLIGVYEGGPGCWNKTWATWRRKSLFFATDPVALDRIGWDIIDKKRAQEGWQPVGRMGLLNRSEGRALALSLAGLAGQDSLSTLVLNRAGNNILDGLGSESFERRQPEHIILAGTLGLGEFDIDRISYRKFKV